MTCTVFTRHFNIFVTSCRSYSPIIFYVCNFSAWFSIMLHPLLVKRELKKWFFFYIKSFFEGSLSSRLNASAGHRFWSHSKKGGPLCSHAPTAFPGFFEGSEGQQRWLAIVAQTGVVITISSVQFPISTVHRNALSNSHCTLASWNKSPFNVRLLRCSKRDTGPRLRLDIKLCHGLAGCRIYSVTFNSRFEIGFAAGLSSSWHKCAWKTLAPFCQG